MSKRKRNKKREKSSALYGFLAALAVLIVIAGAAVYIYKYAPTPERMSLSDYYDMSYDDEMAVVVNSERDATPEGEAPYAVLSDGSGYIRLSYAKDKIDDGYVFDSDAGILRYATADEIISVNVGESGYYRDSNFVDFSMPIVIGEYDTVYISAEFVMIFSPVYAKAITPDGEPARMLIYTADYDYSVSTLKKNTAVRRFGGPKSKILKDGLRGEQLVIVEDYGKWTEVVTLDGIVGCVKNSSLKSAYEEDLFPITAEERIYSHISLEEPICLAWHQVTNQTANGMLNSVLSDTKGVNVLSPTWFYLSDNYGGIANLASEEYVNAAHANGIQVWALVSNFEDRTVDSTIVLNSAAARDALVSSLVETATNYHIDGINVDFEELSISAADGFCQFIKELSIACERNGLILSVDNYPPRDFNAFYSRSMQADYADYVILMGYDEYNGASETAGPTASLPFVVEAVEATLMEVPAGQVVLGMPFYSRVWTSIAADGSGLSSKATGMESIPGMIAESGVEPLWLEEYGLNYVEYLSGDYKYQIWAEDATSLTRKLGVMKEYDLAGGAFWKLGLENSEVWDVIAEYLP